MSPTRTNDPHTLALAALAATLSDERRAHRFLDMSGIETDELRLSAAEPSLLVGLLTFLEAHEPDLRSVADEVGVTPEQLVRAREALEA